MEVTVEQNSEAQQPTSNRQADRPMRAVVSKVTRKQNCDRHEAPTQRHGTENQ